MEGRVNEPIAVVVPKDLYYHERAYVRGLEKALGWFADADNWHEEQLSEGYHFSAEWKLGFDPRSIARRALGRE
jgi:hypothetical protein